MPMVGSLMVLEGVVGGLLPLAKGEAQFFKLAWPARQDGLHTASIKHDSGALRKFL